MVKACSFGENTKSNAINTLCLGSSAVSCKSASGVDEPLEVIGDAVDPLQTFGDCLRRDGDLRRDLVAVNPAEAIEPRWASGIHSLRRTKATLIYRRTGNLRAVQLE